MESPSPLGRLLPRAPRTEQSAECLRARATPEGFGRFWAAVCVVAVGFGRYVVLLLVCVSEHLEMEINRNGSLTGLPLGVCPSPLHSALSPTAQADEC